MRPTSNRRPGGSGDASNLVPLCNGHHREQHEFGIKSFERQHAEQLHGQKLRTIAGAYWLQYEEQNGVRI